MVDPRIKKLAGILVNYSIKMKKGDVIEVSCGPAAAPLALEVYKLILENEALPMLNVGLPGAAYQYYKLATDDMLKTFPKIRMYEAEHTAGSISIGTDYNTKEFTNIDSKKIALRRKVIKPIQDKEMEKDNWVICEYPTDALAQDAEMSLEEFEDFVYSATNVDYEKMDKDQDHLKKLFDKGKTVRIVAKDTDLTFSIDGRDAIKCAGNRNIPDGEIFMAPVDDSANGHIAYSFPAIRGGKEVDGIRLEFKDGEVVRASATKNEDFLLEMIKTDEGAKRLGEFGIGLNFGIKKFIKQILFDEKIGGTVHLALGMAYKEGGGKNDSAIHWDMICDLRNGGELYLDGKLVQKNGKFLV